MSKSKIIGALLVCVFGVSSFFLKDLFTQGEQSLTDGSDYSKRMLQLKCGVKRASTEWANITCSLAALKDVERNCDVLMRFGDLTQATLQCRGQKVSWVQRECKVWMMGTSKGEIACLENAKNRVARYLDRYEGREEKRNSLFGA